MTISPHIEQIIKSIRLVKNTTKIFRKSILQTGYEHFLKNGFYYEMANFHCSIVQICLWQRVNLYNTFSHSF